MSAYLTNEDVRLEFASSQAWWGSPEELGNLFDEWLESVKQEAYSDGLSEGYRLEQELDAAKADAEQRALVNKDAQDGIDDYLKWAGLK